MAQPGPGFPGSWVTDLPLKIFPGAHVKRSSKWPPEGACHRAEGSRANIWKFNQELHQEGREVVQVGRCCLQVFSHWGAAPVLHCCHR